MSRKRLKWSIGTLGLAACVAAAIVIVVVTRPDNVRPANGSAAVVTDQGVTLTIDGITVQGPPGAAPPGLTTNAPADPNVIRFDGIGEFTLRLTAKELLARGYVNKGNLYEGMSAPCVSYAKEGQPLSFSVESKTGRVLAIRNSGGNQSLRTQVGGIRVGSTLAQLRKAFASHRIEEHFSSDFGQGSNGVIVNGSGGSIGVSLNDAPASDYASGRVKITYLNGVGLPDHAPTNMEDGC